MTDRILVLTTCPSAEEAGRIAHSLVESRLAACVAVAPGIRSVYRWQGSIEESAEWALTIKSRRDLFASVSDEIRRLHSYETPEILAVPVVKGSAEYLRWMDESLRPPAGESTGAQCQSNPGTIRAPDVP
jgi:periplasmic divalent cation tolerance protein